MKLDKLWNWLTLVLSVLLLLSVVRNTKRVLNIRQEVENDKQKVEKLKKENEDLVAQINRNQGPEFIEKQVRDKLGLIKQGEKLVVLPDKDTLRKLAPQIPQEKNTLPDPIWKRWLKLFM